MLTIGLTGGIGSGKSSVANLFRELHVTVFDTDDIARQLVEPGRPALKEITDLFGAELLLPDGTLDRAKLRELIFEDVNSRKTLESILHPRIRASLLLSIKQCSDAYCIAVIPLLVENNWQQVVDRVLVVDTEEKLQLQRAAQRDRMPRSVIQNIMHAQASRKQRLSVADDVIVNNGDLHDLREKVQSLHRKYIALSGSHKPPTSKTS